jgi:hypothetical protein
LPDSRRRSGRRQTSAWTHPLTDLLFWIAPDWPGRLH